MAKGRGRLPGINTRAGRAAPEVTEEEYQRMRRRASAAAVLNAPRGTRTMSQRAFTAAQAAARAARNPRRPRRR